MVVPMNSRTCFCDHGHRHSTSVGILAFEAATAMSRLVSLHSFLSDSELRRFLTDSMSSPGVAYLTSTDQLFLLRLACAELLSNLDAVAAVVSRFSARCVSPHLLSFPRTYAYAKIGRATVLSVKGMESRVRKMEKYIALVGKLFEEMDNEQKWMVLMKFGRQPPQKSIAEFMAQRKKVMKLKGESLWCKTFDDVVALMSKTVLAMFARICAVFSPSVPELPPALISGGRISFTPLNPKLRVYPLFTGMIHASSPMDLPEAAGKEKSIGNSCPIVSLRNMESERKLRQVLQPKASTVGGAGLTMQYANIILSAERLMRLPSGDEEREVAVAAARNEIYGMLPAKLRAAVKGRLRRKWRDRGMADGELAEGWREAVERMLRWLGPVARDTDKWQEERTTDRKQRLNAKPRVLALQTLIFSDKEKVEAAIVEVLVGLSCIFWYDGSSCRRNRTAQ